MTLGATTAGRRVRRHPPPQVQTENDERGTAGADRHPFGASVAGKSWGRPDDKIGIAAAINGLSKDHRDYIAAGGLGILIGDGALNYRQEKILETFYGWYIMKGLILTLDYQFMMNPAYNADRGPISFFSARLHGEF